MPKLIDSASSMPGFVGFGRTGYVQHQPDLALPATVTSGYADWRPPQKPIEAPQTALVATPRKLKKVKENATLSQAGYARVQCQCGAVLSETAIPGPDQLFTIPVCQACSG